MRSVLLLLFCGAAFCAELRLEARERPLRIEVAKTGLMRGRKHVFEFTSYRGAVRLDERQPGRTEVEVEVEAGEFRLLDEWVGEKDKRKIAAYTRSPEMLDVGRHPLIRFRSRTAEETGSGSYRVEGRLEIRGVAKPVVVLARTSRQDGELEVEGTAQFRLSDFGLKRPTAALGAIGTSDEVRLEFRLRAVP